MSLRVLAFSTVLVSLAAPASDSLLLSCPVCHGAQPSSTPGLRGQTAAEIESLLRGYRDGSRTGTAMPRIAAAMTDAEIRRVAEFYAESRP